MSDLDKNSNFNPDDDPNGKILFQESTNDSDTKLTMPDSTNASSSNSNKIEIFLKAVGNAPILKRKKFLLDRSKNVKFIIEWLKKYMKLETKDHIFLYVNQEFAPSPDADIGTIYDCFKTGNSVIFYYCITPAWG
ncbi:ubiquitin ATG12 [Brachionus plicatilis]|uniref:Ubiquitin-like protein ATG12 n=1 Tax=Brachionus plicatilis TaxID=10195 RepID=A0A2Z4EUK3_BRAPC|nr:autophagy-related protein 12 [Brachionus plicatilis]RNA41397.1 ubiquitin ATG12 [Brachionus plicatilis]